MPDMVTKTGKPVRPLSTRLKAFFSSACFAIAVISMQPGVKKIKTYVPFNPGNRTIKSTVCWTWEKTGKYHSREISQIRQTVHDQSVFLNTCTTTWELTAMGTPGSRTWVTLTDMRLSSDGMPEYVHERKYNIDTMILSDEILKTYSKNKVRIVLRRSGKKEKKKKYRVSSKTVDERQVPFMMAFMPPSVKRARALVVTDHRKPAKINIIYRGKETLTINGKKTVCDKYKLQPELGVFNFMRGMIPNTVFWFDEKSRVLLQYRGLSASSLFAPVLKSHTESHTQYSDQ